MSRRRAWEHPIWWMFRRRFLMFALTTPAMGFYEEGREVVRGRLLQDASGPPAIVSGTGRTIVLDGDADTLAVLRDERLKDDHFEVLGSFAADGRFRVNPIYNRALFVYRGGKRLVITYWCEVCAIRGFSPGKCRCCQEEMALDPRDPALGDAERSGK